jgi:5'-nucleotidase
MKILITNDDGIHAAGLLALRGALAPLGEVVAIAPERPRSACGHAITLHKPLRLTRVTMIDGAEGFASNGTPADCVALGTSEHFGGPPELVVAGINSGPNLGIDMIYSGTVAAAMEAAICGIPSFSISVASYRLSEFGAAAEFAGVLAEVVFERKLPRGSFLNVNVPAAPRDQIAGVAITRPGSIRYENRIEKRTDPRGGAYYWLTGDRLDQRDGEGSDVEAIARNVISVTPITLDFSDHALAQALAGWGLRWPTA